MGVHFKSAESQLMSRPWAQGEGISNCVCVCGGWVGAACVSVSPTDSLPLFTPSSPYRFRECQQLPFLPALSCFLTSSWDHSPFCPSLMPSLLPRGPHRAHLVIVSQHPVSLSNWISSSHTRHTAGITNGSHF